MRWHHGLGAATLAACAAPARVAAPTTPAPASHVDSPVDPLRWAAVTASPSPDDLAPRERVAASALARCGGSDRALDATARGVLLRKQRGYPIPAADELAIEQRAAGEPHPWGRAWVASGPGLDEGAALRDLDGWLSLDPGARRRCGVAAGTAGDGTRTLVVVAVDALADLAPLPTHARTGQWLSVDARMAVPARGGAVFVSGRTGPARALLTSFDGTRLRARFAPDHPDAFTVQVVADLGAGPRPVLEAMVYADLEPPARPEDTAAPGESLPSRDGPDDDDLARMLDAARLASGIPSLRRDPALDAVAREHAARAAAAGALSHDLGDGNPVDRLLGAGLQARFTGENLAHASTPSLAHRMLWASPSHRANMLGASFDRVGVAVARDPRGDAWVVEEFAGP
ncbi:MAG TPA: CAP domain-containing protein [Polyangiaceae bacterium]|nr:CAP domain-containing protein [Polyangiaceae bacterium]